MEVKARILVIDDEPGLRDLLAFELTQQGYTVFCAANGESGVEKAREEKINVVISDIKMQGMDGIAVLGEIKKIDPSIEVVMATGFGTMETVVESLRRGAFDYINKPFNISEISIVIEKALEKQQMQETLSLYEISRSMFSTIKIDELLRITIDATLKTMRADDTSLMLLDEENKLYIAISSGLSEDIREKTRIEIGQGISGWVAKEKESLLLIGDLKNDERFKHLNSHKQVKSSIVLPLEGKQGIIGVLNINRVHVDEVFTKNDLRKATIFASLVTLAIENANLYKDLEVAQAQIVQASKMAAVGQLAAGIVHEINSPVGFISSNLSVLQEYMEKINQVINGVGVLKETAEQKDVEGILKAKQQLSALEEDVGFDNILADIQNIIVESQEGVARIQKIGFNLKSFSRLDDQDVDLADLNEVLDRVLHLVWNEIKYKVTLNKEYGDIPMIECNAQQLGQVFVNIIINASQAIAKNGTISIQTYCKEQRVCVVIKDTGAGIPADIIEKIFDPFFTTKGIGEGTGLGLSVSSDIIKNHDGAMMDVESEKGKGTTFIISFPVKE